MRRLTLALSVFVALVLAVPGAVPVAGQAARAATPVAAPTGPGAVVGQSIQDQVAKLISTDGAAGDVFGASVSVRGNIAVVGAMRADLGGNVDQGAAYVFYRDQGGPNVWGQVAKLTAADGAADDIFGYSVSVSGDIVVVGAPQASIGGNSRQGAVYVFYRNQDGPDAWGQVAKLTAADGGYNEQFGYDVYLDGDMALVGAPGATAVYGFEGAAYFFDRDEGGPDTWGQVAKLTATDAQALDEFGNSVSFDGDVAIVGAIGVDIWEEDEGAAYIFYRNPGEGRALRAEQQWHQVTKLTRDSMYSDYGISVSVSGDTAVVGMDEAYYSHVGSAYVYYRNQGGADQWGWVRTLHAGDPVYGDAFGYSAMLKGDSLVVGAPWAEVGGGVPGAPGATYVFFRDEGGPDAWGQVDKLTAADGADGDCFGCSVAFSGDMVLSGAGRADVGGQTVQGAAYVHSLPSSSSLHLNRIRMVWRPTPRPGVYTVRSVTLIHDQDEAPAPEVTVYGDWTLPGGTVRHKMAVTNSSGRAKFSLWVTHTGTYQFCVTDLVKAGYVYDPGADEVPACQSLVVGP